MSEEASERVSGASEQANGRASGPVLTSLFLFVPDHSAMAMCSGMLNANLQSKQVFLGYYRNLAYITLIVTLFRVF